MGRVHQQQIHAETIPTDLLGAEKNNDQAKTVLALEAYQQALEIIKSTDLVEHIVSVEMTNIATQTHFHLSKLHLQQKNYDQAIVHLENIELKKDLLSHKQQREVQYNLGLAYQQIHQPKEAARAYNRLLLMVRDIPTADEWTILHFYLGLVYHQDDQYVLAIDAYKKAAQHYPKNWQILFHLGKSYYQYGNYVLALKTFEKASKLKPNYPPILNDLGTTSKSLGNFSEAVSYYQKAILLNPTDPI